MNICIIGNPLLELGEDERDRFTGKSISWDGWGDLFYDLLKVPPPVDYAAGEPFSDFEARKTSNFSQFVCEKGFPLLSRISDIYDDVIFQSDEIKELRNECITLQGYFAGTRPGAEVLRNLIAACDSAIVVGAGIILSGDYNRLDPDKEKQTTAGYIDRRLHV